jgi:hypothetical protein
VSYLLTLPRTFSFLGRLISHEKSMNKCGTPCLKFRKRVKPSEKISQEPPQYSYRYIFCSAQTLKNCVRNLSVLIFQEETVGWSNTVSITEAVTLWWRAEGRETAVIHTHTTTLICSNPHHRFQSFYIVSRESGYSLCRQCH